MYPRTEYEMSEEDLKSILNSCKPTPVIYGSGGTPLFETPQENANRAWKELGKKMGFDSWTVRPIQGKGNRFFTAIPSETEHQCKEREGKEREEKRLKRIAEIKQEISIRNQELQGLEENPTQPD